MKRRVRKDKGSSNSNNNNTTTSLKRKQTEQLRNKEKKNIFDNDLLTAREKRWLNNNNNAKLKYKLIRQYLPEENILKWKPIPKTSKKTLKKIVSKTLNIFKKTFFRFFRFFSFFLFLLLGHIYY